MEREEIDILCEALKINDENARFHERQRWPYIYFFYVAYASSLYFGIKGEYIFDLVGNINYAYTVLIFSMFLIMIGFGSFFHLIYHNVEKSNCIRCSQHIARKLNLNENMDSYLDIIKKHSSYCSAEKDLDNISYYTYLALPLMLGIRKKLGAVMIHAILISSMILFVIICFLSIASHYIDLIKNIFFSDVYYIIILFILFIIIFYSIVKWSYHIENEAKRELDRRNPNSIN